MRKQHYPLGTPRSEEDLVFEQAQVGWIGFHRAILIGEPLSSNTRMCTAFKPDRGDLPTSTSCACFHSCTGRKEKPLSLSRRVVLFMIRIAPHSSPDHFRRSLCVAAWCLAGAGCQSYHPKPLDEAAVNRALTVPGDEILAQRAEALDHPILRPIVLDDRDGMSPDEAAVLAVVLNPSLRAARDAAGIAAAQTIEAGLLPNPELSASLGTPTGGDRAGAVNPYGFGLSWDFTALIGRQQRIDAADASARAIDLKIAWREWQTAQAARLAVIDLLTTREKIAITQGIEDRASGLVEEFQTALAHGQITSQTLASAQRVRDEWRAQRLELQQDAASRRIELNTLLGLPAERVIELDAQSVRDATNDLLDPEILRAGIESRRLDLLALHRVYDARDASLRGAVLSQFPRIVIGIEHARDTDTVQTTSIGVSIELPIFDRGQGRIGRAEAERQQVFDEYTSRTLIARNDVIELIEATKLIDARIAESERIEQTRTTHIDLLTRGAERNQAPRDEVLDAAVEQARSALETASLHAERFHALVALELASGQPLVRFGIDERTPAP